MTKMMLLLLLPYVSVHCINVEYEESLSVINKHGCGRKGKDLREENGVGC